MLCYRDMTFCDFAKTCKDAGDCPRAVTEELEKKAHDFGLPLCLFMEKPSCYVELKNETT